LFYSTYGCANGIPVRIEGQYKSISEEVDFGLGSVVFEYIRLRFDGN
jgi:hypothetical protein